MTDLRKMSLFRDVQVALEFQQMAAQGYVDTEFTMYGTIYYTDDQRQYMISANAPRIIDFIDTDIDQGYLALPLCTLTETCHVPAGERERIANEVKVRLARKLQTEYSVQFMRLLARLNKREGNDMAKPLLTSLCKKYANTFSADRLDVLEQLVRYAYRRKVLTSASYEEFQAWFSEERENLADDIIPKDIMSKTWYTLTYEDRPGHKKQLTNARKEWAYNKKIALEKEGKIVAPVYAHTYWYNNQNGMMEDTRDQHQALCRKLLDDEYWEAVREIAGYPAFISAEDLVGFLSECEQDSETEALRYFGNVWRIVQKSD